MLYKKLFKIFSMCFILFVISIFVNSSRVEAYVGCNYKIENTEFYDCGNYVYTYPADYSKSSMIYAMPGNNVVYAGEREGYHLFYVNDFRYYNRTYDDRSLKNNNIWTSVSSIYGVVFSGEFKDSILLDETHEGVYNGGYSIGAGKYEVIQYHQNGEVYSKLLIYNISDSISNIYNTNVKSFDYDGTIIEPNVNTDVVELNDKLIVNLNTSFGIKDFYLKVDGVEVENYRIINNSVIFDAGFNKYLNKGNVNTIEVYAKNYLGTVVNETYFINALSTNVSINFSSISSDVISSSRRIVISAHAGIGKTLDTDYCWYYWSTSANDSLEYEDFLVNYAKSEYKGSYSEDKGVILRNTSGTYYLYALAKDEDSYIVSRSEGYTLDDNGFSFELTINDWIFIVSLLILVVVPILIYLSTRRRLY